MNKTILAFDGLKYSKSTRDYGVYLAGHTKTHLAGLFLDDRTYNSYKIYDLLSTDGLSAHKLKKMEEKDKATREMAANDFIKTCRVKKLNFTIHHDCEIAIHELKHESIYADLLIIDSKETLTHYTEKIPTRFIRDLLGDVQCPVLVVPEKYKPIKKIVLLYDGEPSSVRAIKMFSYLLPQLKHLETEIISVNPINSKLHLPDSNLVKEFMKSHYPKAKFITLKGFAEDKIIAHLKQEPGNTIVVLGAYQRGAVSRWFRESMADVLMKKLQLPLFIAHNK